MKRSVLSWLVMVLALAGLMAYVGPTFFNVTSPPVKSTGKALIGGAFTLVDGTGNTVTEKSFAGKYMLVFFGFTHCPDICPTSLLVTKNALEKIGSKAEKLTPIFITIDPERDTVDVVGRYVQNFGTQFVGLSGTPEQIKQAADAYKVYYQKVEDKDSGIGYVMDHSGFIYLMDPEGNYVTHFPHTISEQALAEALGNYL
ncbi:MAG: SCO family protein [Alphaproteobacteria bacterium]|nr:SCO family protein [Alphaproteobacteria bacterium]